VTAPDAVVYETGDEPIRAWKTGGIRLNVEGGAVFVPAAHTRAFYHAIDTAVCTVCKEDDRHDAPKLDCTCGFYAMKTREGVDWHGPLYEVELYGRVIEGEFGYRAEKQRVLCAHLPETCKCGKACDSIATALDTVGVGCAECMAWEIDMLTAKTTSPVDIKPLALADLAAALGTEVRFG
jgi:hypothetical protein